MGWVALGCVLGVTGCRERERSARMDAPKAVSARQTVEAPTVPEALAAPAAPASAPVAMTSTPETGGSTQPAQRQGSAAAPAGAQARNLLEDEDRIWLSETAESARAGNANISPDARTEDITLATGTVDGRVKRVRKGTIEVSDGEGNLYALRIDKHSRGLRKGRKVPLHGISEGTPVRASFDLKGGGDSIARDIVLRR
jgi:hypothetical protein